MKFQGLITGSYIIPSEKLFKPHGKPLSPTLPSPHVVQLEPDASWDPHGLSCANLVISLPGHSDWF